jgi:predicted ATP-grasp superfamily ATP-dependent carboligase
LLNQFERSDRILENRSENLIKFKNSLENLKTYKKTTYDEKNNGQGQYEKSDVEIIFAPKSLSSAEIRDREKNLQLFHSSTTSIKSSAEIKFNPEKKELKNKVITEITYEILI